MIIPRLLDSGWVECKEGTYICLRYFHKRGWTCVVVKDTGQYTFYKKWTVNKMTKVISISFKDKA